MATPNAPLKTTLTASTQLFATPRRAPQFRIAQVRVKARPRAERYLPGEESSSIRYCTETRKTRCYLVEGGVEERFAITRASSRRRVVADGLYDEGRKRVPFCGSASAAASGRPEVWEDIGDRSTHGEGWVTQRGSVVVRLSVRDRVAVGGGRMYTAVVPRSS